MALRARAVCRGFPGERDETKRTRAENGVKICSMLRYRSSLLSRERASNSADLINEAHLSGYSEVRSANRDYFTQFPVYKRALLIIRDFIAASLSQARNELSFISAVLTKLRLEMLGIISFLIASLSLSRLVFFFYQAITFRFFRPNGSGQRLCSRIFRHASSPLPATRYSFTKITRFLHCIPPSFPGIFHLWTTRQSRICLSIRTPSLACVRLRGPHRADFYLAARTELPTPRSSQRAPGGVVWPRRV